jgi:hypothetical protein
MMNKKYLMNGFAALALVASVSSCTKDVTAMSQGEIDAKAKENAELQLGFSIPDGQTWNMASQVEANVAINLGLDQSYTVGIYDENPLYNEKAKYYILEEVNEGETLNSSLTIPSNLQTVYIAVYDSKYRSVVHAVNVENGQIVANIGGTAAGSRSMRAVEDASVYPQYVKTLNNYLNPSADEIKAFLQVKDKYNNYINPGYNTFAYTSGGIDGITVNTISLSDLSKYVALTNNMIINDTSNGNHTITDPSFSSGLNGAFIGNGDGKHFLVDTGTEITTKLHANGSVGVVNDVVIVVKGTLHLYGNYQGTLNGVTLVVADGGEIVLEGEVNGSNTTRIIVESGGTISAGESGGSLKINNGMPCYNAGTIDFDGELNVNGSNFYNNGTITVDVLRNTSGGKFTNFGHITARTNTIQGDAYNCSIVNGCYFHFTEDAGSGPMTLLDNSRFEVDGQLYITGGYNNTTPSTMYNLSELNAGSIYCQDAVINGPTSQGSFSIVKTSKFLVSHGGDIKITNNAYVDCNPDEFYNYQNKRYKDIYNDNDYTYQAAYYIINNNISHWTSESSSALIIPEGDCTGMGNNPGGGGGKIYGDPVVYTYAFEDQTVGTDYDMNDVVLKVSYKVQENGTGENAGKVIYNTNKLAVKLVAAGATYNIKVKIGDTYLFGGKEIHEALGVNPGVMVNTGNGKAQTATPISDEIAVPTGWEGDFTQLPVSIEVTSTNMTYSYPNTDEYPHAIMVPTDWAWPTERTIITEAYPGSGTETITAEDGTVFPINSFSAWAATPAANRATVLGSVKWYETSAANGKTMTNQ